jgi:PII-like signaling protein
MSEQVLLSVITLHDDKAGLMSTVPEKIVSRVHKLGLSGATLLRENDPIDNRGRLTKLVHPHHPTVVEIIDTAEKIDAAFDKLFEGIPDTVIVLRERVDVMRGGDDR